MHARRHDPLLPLRAGNTAAAFSNHLRSSGTGCPIAPAHFRLLTTRWRYPSFRASMTIAAGFDARRTVRFSTEAYISIALSNKRFDATAPIAPIGIRSTWPRGVRQVLGP